MKVKDIIQTDKFNEFLGYEIEAYNNRPALEEGKGLPPYALTYGAMSSSG